MIGKLFGPLMLLWFSMLGVLGAMHIGDYSIRKLSITYTCHPFADEVTEWF